MASWWVPNAEIMEPFSRTALAETMKMGVCLVPLLEVCRVERA